MIFRPITNFLREQIILVILFGMLGGLVLIILIPILANIDFGGGDGCSVSSRPTVPVLLGVTQDPETLTVTATVRDESTNEQWFSLERTLIARNNQLVSVGTDVEVPDNHNLPVSKDTGRIVTIVDNGIVQGRKPEPGELYVYTVRALNCYAESPRSNDISIVALSPRQGRAQGPGMRARAVSTLLSWSSRAKPGVRRSSM